MIEIIENGKIMIHILVQEDRKLIFYCIQVLIFCFKNVIVIILHSIHY